MPELRKDPITGRWVIISTERGKRPNDFLRESVIPREEKNCPFCLGNEARTPPEILVYGRNGGGPNSPGWSIRVVPNKFPALGIEGDLGGERCKVVWRLDDDFVRADSIHLVKETFSLAVQIALDA